MTRRPQRALRLLCGLALLGVCCDALWRPFLTPRDCDPATGADCGVASVDGAAPDAQDAADAPDAASPPPDLTDPKDSLPPTGWAKEMSGVASSIDLRSVSGGPSAGGGPELWAVGTGGVVTYRDASTGLWTPFVAAGDPMLTLGRVAYLGPGEAWAVAVPPNPSKVLRLTSTGAAVPGMQPATGPFTGLVAHSAPSPTVYVVNQMGGVYSAAIPLMGPGWLLLIPPPGAVSGSNSIAQVSRAGVVEIYGGFSNVQQQVYQQAAGWTLLGSLLGPNAIWARPGPGGVWWAGAGGKIGYSSNQMAPPATVVLQVSPVTDTLNDVAGTPDGRHIWIVGNNGRVLRCDAPLACTWVVETEAAALIGNAYGVWANNTDVWVVGAMGTILHRVI